MADFTFPSLAQLERDRRSLEGFGKVQVLLDQVRLNMIRRGPTHDSVCLRFPADASRKIRETVRDVINAVNGGRDWEAELTYDEGPVLVVRKRQN